MTNDAKQVYKWESVSVAYTVLLILAVASIGCVAAVNNDYYTVLFLMAYMALSLLIFSMIKAVCDDYDKHTKFIAVCKKMFGRSILKRYLVFNYQISIGALMIYFMLHIIISTTYFISRIIESEMMVGYSTTIIIAMNIVMGIIWVGLVIFDVIINEKRDFIDPFISKIKAAASHVDKSNELHITAVAMIEDLENHINETFKSAKNDDIYL